MHMSGGEIRGSLCGQINRAEADGTNTTNIEADVTCAFCLEILQARTIHPIVGKPYAKCGIRRLFDDYVYLENTPAPTELHLEALAVIRAELQRRPDGARLLSAWEAENTYQPDSKVN